MLDYILLAIVAILGIGLGLFTLNEAKKLQATRTEHGISADNTD